MEEKKKQETLQEGMTVEIEKEINVEVKQKIVQEEVEKEKGEESPKRAKMTKKSEKKNLKTKDKKSENIKEDEAANTDKKGPEDSKINEETKEGEKSAPNLQDMKKTKFPISRIKKIIQEDEDVGKTSSTVPVALSKACEIFIEEIVTKCEGIKKITKKDVIDALKGYKMFKEEDFENL